MPLQNLYSSLGKQGAEEEDKRKTKVRRIQEERDHTEVEEEEVYAMAYKEEVARRIDLERKLEECQAVNEKVVSELEESIKARETEEARRVEAERKLEEALALNDKLLAQVKDGQIAILLLDCHTNWQKMVESGDLTALKTLETYNAIHRISVSVIHHHFTMTLGHTETKGVTALHMAAVKGNAEMSRLLLLHPAIDVNAVDQDGRTPFVYAYMKGHLELVKVLLLDGRVDINKADK
eukprot:gene1835-2154_t